MLRRFGLALLILAVVAWTGLLQAQPPHGGQGGHGGHGGHGGPPGGMMFRGGMGMGGGSSMFLLRLEQVQEELEIVDDQKEELKKIGEKMREETRGMFGGANFREMSSEERRTHFQKMGEKRKTLEKKYSTMVGEVLLPHQTERLKQIAFQMQGNRALSNEEVVKELKITDEQKEQFKTIRDEFGGKMRELFSGIRELEPDERRQRMEKGREALGKMRTDLEAKILDVLTSEQKEKIEKMKGKKFELDRQRLMKSFQGRARRGPPGKEGRGRGGPGRGPNRGGPDRGETSRGGGVF